MSVVNKKKWFAKMTVSTWFDLAGEPPPKTFNGPTSVPRYLPW